MPVCSTCGTQYGATVRICVCDGTPLVAGRASDPYLGVLLDGKYRIESFISAGGMGSVYRAQHVMLGKTVAVKVIRNELVTSDEVVSRFQREARAASNLNHPNIVTVYDLGQTADGTLYIAMEFIEGASLHDIIRRNGPLAPARTVDILRQVASALSAAHRKHIVHRDLKSHNLMITADHGGRDLVKLVDFGIAKTFDSATQLTAAGYMLGTPHYMSPEQACGSPVDHRADLYSLGVILYEMLTGRVPFGDDSLSAVLVKLAREAPPRPSACRPDLLVPPALEGIAMRCLQKNPADRFQSADEFDDALARAHAAGLPPLPASAEGRAATLVRAAAQPPRETSAAPPPRLRPEASARQGEGAPAARAHPGVPFAALLTGRASAIAAAIAVALAVAIASGIALSHDPGAGPVAPAPLTASATAPAPSTTLLEAPVAAAPAPNPTAPSLPPGQGSTISDPVRRRTGGTERQEGRRVVPALVSESIAPGTSAPRATPRPQAAGPGALEQPSISPVQAATPAQAAQTGAAPPTAVAPVVSARCDGFPDVCSAIRSEMTRAFQRAGMTVAADGAPADAVVTADVALISETASADFGTPMLTRTYSVELTGSSRGAALAMPEPRRFSFDPRVGSARLAEQARLIAADSVESVRAFLTRSGR